MMIDMPVVAIVPSAGRGRRLKSKLPKTLVTLHSIPLFVWTLRMLQAAYPFESIVVPVHPNDLALMKKASRRFGIHGIVFTHGGRTRSDSVKMGLKKVRSKKSLVLVHDMARPFVDRDEIRRLIQVASRHGACILALRSTSTVKEVDTRSRFIKRTLNRDEIFLAQTPQVFRGEILRKAYRVFKNDAANFTDEASLVEALPHRVSIIEGTSSNIKITTDQDLKLAKALLQKPKVLS